MADKPTCAICGADHAVCGKSPRYDAVRPVDLPTTSRSTRGEPVDVYEVEVRPGVKATLKLTAEAAKQYPNAKKVSAGAAGASATTKKRTAKNK